jgi:hypothetical protein
MGRICNEHNPPQPLAVSAVRCIIINVDAPHTLDVPLFAFSSLLALTSGLRQNSCTRQLSFVFVRNTYAPISSFIIACIDCLAPLPCLPTDPFTPCETSGYSPGAGALAASFLVASAHFTLSKRTVRHVKLCCQQGNANN